MTNRVLTALVLRIAAIYIFITVSDQFAFLILSTYISLSMSPPEESSVIAVERFYQSGAILIVANVILSLFFFLKAEWLAKKVIPLEKEITADLNPKSLTKTVLVLIGIIWLSKALYLLPEYIEYGFQLAFGSNDGESSKVNLSELVSYILKIGIALLFVFKVEKISNWIMKRM